VLIVKNDQRHPGEQQVPRDRGNRFKESTSRWALDAGRVLPKAGKMRQQKVTILCETNKNFIESFCTQLSLSIDNKKRRLFSLR
jgi:hypothetical protein